MGAIPNTRRDFESMHHATRVRIYRAARNHAVRSEPETSVTAFDEDMADRAAPLMASGWSRGAAFTSAALSDYLGAFTTYHRHESQETRDWSSMEATCFSTTERHQAAWDALASSI